MLLRVMKGSALAAKIHAMTGSTLHQEDYDALVQMQSIPAVANYLNENTRYRRVLQNAPLSTLHRGRLEQLLKTQTRHDILSLLHYTDTRNTFFLKTLQIQDEIETIKIYLRLLHIGHPEYIAAQTMDLPYEKKGLKASELSEIRSFDEFLEYTKNTPFYRVFRTFADDPARQELFYLEVALDTYLAKLTHRAIKKNLSPEDARLTMKLFGTETDLDNLIFLLRCKERFAMTEEEIYASMIPTYYRLRPETIRQIVAAEDVPAALRIIQSETPYGKAFREDDRFFEQRKNDYMAHMHRTLCTNHPYSLQAALSYIALRRIEINNIVSIVEGIRYGLSPKEIQSHLIGYAKGGALS